jgi:hypothetical protein
MSRKADLTKKSQKELIAIILKNEKTIDEAATQLDSIIGDITYLGEKTEDLQQLAEDMARTAAEKDEVYKAESEAHKEMVNKILVMTSENVAKSLYHVMKVKEHTGEIEFDDVEYLLDLNLRELIFLTSEK